MNRYHPHNPLEFAAERAYSRAIGFFLIKRNASARLQPAHRLLAAHYYRCPASPTHPPRVAAAACGLQNPSALVGDGIHNHIQRLKCQGCRKVFTSRIRAPLYYISPKD
jgi:hypothetical protein